MPESTPNPSSSSAPDVQGTPASSTASESAKPQTAASQTAASESKTQQARQSIQRLTAIFEDAERFSKTEKSGEKAAGAESDSEESNSDADVETPPESGAQETQKEIDAKAEGADNADDALAGAMLTVRKPSSTASATQSDLEADSEATSESVTASAPADSASTDAAEPEADGEKSQKAVDEPEQDNAAASTGATSGDNTDTPQTATLSPDQQVRIKREEEYLSLIFPREQAIANPDVTVDFVDSELWQQLQQRLSGSERFWQDDTPVHLNAQNHLLDARQFQELEEALDRFDLKLTRIATSRRQTAVAAATAGFSVDQGAELPQLLPFSAETEAKPKALAAEPLYLQTTVRSGAEIRHPGSVIIMGDLNPGSSVVADGDILIWGRLRGIAHAGAGGNQNSVILAMRLEPTQLRIAGSVARVPDAAPTAPEVAYVTGKGDIRIAEAAGFIRPRR